MPITLLHIGLMAPFMRHRRAYAALVAFVLINLWIDMKAIAAVFFNLPFPPHTEASHTFPVALAMGLIIAAPGVICRSVAWVAGAFFGAISHVLLDALVHADMDLFATGSTHNPLYLGLMTHVSVLLVLPTAWVTLRCVLDAGQAARKLLAALAQRFGQRSP